MISYHWLLTLVTVVEPYIHFKLLLQLYKPPLWHVTQRVSFFFNLYDISPDLEEAAMGNLERTCFCLSSSLVVGFLEMKERNDDPCVQFSVCVLLPHTHILHRCNSVLENYQRIWLEKTQECNPHGDVSSHRMWTSPVQNNCDLKLFFFKLWNIYIYIHSLFLRNRNKILLLTLCGKILFHSNSRSQY